jgi:hypothetical protein
MNALIKRLAFQADNGFGNSLDDLSDAIVGEDAIQKFAELIVKECARVGGDIVLNQNEDNDMGVFLGIKQHFGVAS